MKKPPFVDTINPDPDIVAVHDYELIIGVATQLKVVGNV